MSNCLDCKTKKLVYLIYNEQTKLIKVGVTSNLSKRKRTLELNGGLLLKVIYTTEDLFKASTVEYSFKRYFLLNQTEGEWFDITQDEAINTLCFIVDNLRIIYKENL